MKNTKKFLETILVNRVSNRILFGISSVMTFHSSVVLPPHSYKAAHVGQLALTLNDITRQIIYAASISISV